MYRCSSNGEVRNFLATEFKGGKPSCLPCHFSSAEGKEIFTEKMKRKIDSTLWGEPCTACGRPLPNRSLPTSAG